MKKNRGIVVISTLLLIAALIGSLFLDDALGSRISNIVTIITAIIGAVALFIQFKKDKEINQSTFVLDFVKEFRATSGYVEVTNELEMYRKKQTKSIKFEENYTSIVSYLQWIETLSALLKTHVIDIEKIDDLLSYNVFIMLNNKIVQDKEIVPNKAFYKGTYTLYWNWYKYKKKNNLPIIMEQTSLHLTPGFMDIVEPAIKTNKKGKNPKQK